MYRTIRAPWDIYQYFTKPEAVHHLQHTSYDFGKSEKATSI